MTAQPTAFRTGVQKQWGTVKVRHSAAESQLDKECLDSLLVGEVFNVVPPPEKRWDIVRNSRHTRKNVLLYGLLKCPAFEREMIEEKCDGTFLTKEASTRRVNDAENGSSGASSALRVSLVQSNRGIRAQKRHDSLPRPTTGSTLRTMKRVSTSPPLRSESAPGKLGYSSERSALRFSDLTVFAEGESVQGKYEDSVKYFGSRSMPASCLQFRDPVENGICSGKYELACSDPFCHKQNDDESKEDVVTASNCKPIRELLQVGCSRDTSSTTLASTICVHGAPLAQNLPHRGGKQTNYFGSMGPLSPLPSAVTTECSSLHANAKLAPGCKRGEGPLEFIESSRDGDIQQCCEIYVNHVDGRKTSGGRPYISRNASRRMLRKKLLVLSQRLALKTEEVKLLRKHLTRLGIQLPPSLAHQHFSNVSSAGPSLNRSNTSDRSNGLFVNAVSEGRTKPLAIACNAEENLCCKARVYERKRGALEKLLNARSGTTSVVKEAFILHVMSHRPPHTIVCCNGDCCDERNSTAQVALSAEGAPKDTCQSVISSRVMACRPNCDTPCERMGLNLNQQVECEQSVCSAVTVADTLPGCLTDSQCIRLEKPQDWNKPCNQLTGCISERQHWTRTCETRQLSDGESFLAARSRGGTTATKYFVFSSSGTSPSESSADESVGETSRMGSRVSGCQRDIGSCSSCYEARKISFRGDEEGCVCHRERCSLCTGNQPPSRLPPKLEPYGVQCAVAEADEWLQMWLQRSSGRALSLSSQESDSNSCNKRGI